MPVPVIWNVVSFHNQDVIFAARPRLLGPPKATAFLVDIEDSATPGDEVSLLVYDNDSATPRTAVHSKVGVPGALAATDTFFATLQLPWPGDGDDIGYTFLHRIRHSATASVGVNWVGGHTYRVVFTIDASESNEGNLQLVYNVKCVSVGP